ncbi:hypothetical protein ACWD7C_36360 [Streptomyces sp. NPDC005134]
MPLLTGIDLPGYLTAPAIHHGAVPAHTVRSLLGRTERAVVARAMAVLTTPLPDTASPKAPTSLPSTSHPGYPALRAARVARADRWADLFRTQGRQVRAVRDTNGYRFAFVLTPPAPAPAPARRR